MDLKKRIDFKNIAKYSIMGFLFYTQIIMLFVLDSVPNTYQDIVLIFLPLPLFLFAAIFLLEKDEQIERDNETIRRRIDHIKKSYTARKLIEDNF